MVMNSKKQVFGVVERAEENKDYTGKETNTAKVTVDNINREISVDVDFTEFTGETADKAYPGNQGYENRQAIGRLQESIADEQTRAQDAESTILSKVRQEEISRVEADIHIHNKIDQKEAELKAADTAINNRIADEVNRSTSVDTETDARLDTIESTYATKEYVSTQIAEYTKLSKQIVDDVDVEKNVIIKDGKETAPLDGVIYLVSDTTNEGDSTYRQYTSIDGKLTLIGDTKINLDDYATTEFVASTYATKTALSEEIENTKSYVNQQIEAIPEVDLTGYATENWVAEQNYATKAEIPDVDSFISEIPSEYITESELEEKGYLTTETAEEDFATKIYVQQEIAKIGSFSKVIVDSINIDDKTVTIEGETTPAEQDIIYLVPIVDESEETTAYQQWMIINDELTNIGNTSVDLNGYATTEYVDSKIEEVSNNVSTVNSSLQNFIKSFNSIEFIDGGTSASIFKN